MIELLAEATLPSDFGEYRMSVFSETPGNLEHIAIVFGQPEQRTHPIVRVHSACITSEIFHANNCDCRQQLDFAFSTFRQNGGGILVYLDQEGRGNGLPAKLEAMRLVSAGEPPHRAFQKLGYPADARKYGAVAEILDRLGVHQPIELLTNNPNKISELEAAGVRIAAHRPCYTRPRTDQMKRDLESKRDELGHHLPSDIEIEH